jgi:hypothetical protein
MSVSSQAAGDPSIYNIGANTIVGYNTYGSLELKLPENRDFQDVQSRLSEIERRLAILKPNEILQAKYPALQEAYDHYKLIERLVEGNNGT